MFSIIKLSLVYREFGKNGDFWYLVFRREFNNHLAD